MTLPEKDKETLHQVADLLRRLSRQFYDHPWPEEEEARLVYRRQSGNSCLMAANDLKYSSDALLVRLNAAERLLKSSRQACLNAERANKSLKAKYEKLQASLLYFQALDRMRISELLEKART